MRCPHCTVNFHDNWERGALSRGGYYTSWIYRTADCPACSQVTIEIAYDGAEGGADEDPGWLQVHPSGSNRGPVPPEVPKPIAQDYVEGCLVLPLSPKASAALARRCLQNILRAHGYKDRDLAKEIDLILNEPDPRKGIPESLRNTIDGIRNFGNFSAHPITDLTTLQIIDVEPQEAEWCLEIVEEMFQHFYVRPAQAAARKAALDAKLKSAGKPPSKK